MDALIGYTGFVGGCLREQRSFDQYVNRSNIDALAGASFDTVVCAAAPGSMFEANRDPERDELHIRSLAGQLSRISAKRFVLISTIAVLEKFSANSEQEARYETELAYGRNRRALEVAMADHFSETLIVRLPALFGPGLKKNFLFDILNPMPSMLPSTRLAALTATLGTEDAELVGHFYQYSASLDMMVLDRAGLQASGRRSALDAAVEAAGFAASGFTNPDSVFQFYNMARLWGDIERGLAGNLSVLHIAPPPLKAASVYAAVNGTSMPRHNARLHAEDMRTAYAALWDQEGAYMATPDTSLNELADFIAAQRAVA
ncbi:hypothetical protein QE361_002584 [Sphingomonas sp. SORGH_AS802]|uniref:hypothetical protein n=1 Tax=unclassified Sphingomonas TaxID=196159 RepID=UPI002864FA01|nr:MULTISPECIES: hypothetical protein [unclassified Sphingomonas]MDR6128207.1 hypothetical protein [Sphingomonas sp. SORGH_AS_0438]MDR6135589.1 hypothetical protein [Sphingomonas sp. SORGH_AS_0802]